MNKMFAGAGRAAGRALAVGFVAGAVLAGATRGAAQLLPHVWVSPPYGSSSGTGVATSPVQTLAQAFLLVADGGQINVRDPGELGPLGVSKSVEPTHLEQVLSMNIITSRACAQRRIKMGGAIA